MRSLIGEGSACQPFDRQEQGRYKRLDSELAFAVINNWLVCFVIARVIVNACTGTIAPDIVTQITPFPGAIFLFISPFFFMLEDKKKRPEGRFLDSARERS